MPFRFELQPKDRSHSSVDISVNSGDAADRIPEGCIEVYVSSDPGYGHGEWVFAHLNRAEAIQLADALLGAHRLPPSGATP